MKEDILHKETININKPWPKEGLESISQCPVCGNSDKILLYNGLKDRVFFCAQGEWTLWRCRNCSSAYINPRPNKETIGLAYRNYFTHETSINKIEALSLWKRFRRTLANGFRNYKFGSDLHPSSRLGIALALFPEQLNMLNSAYRNLEKLNSNSSKQRLLDIGCGNGGFLFFAKSTGREVVGIDLDEKAVSVARENGLDARLGSIDILDSKREKFDIITLGHVIEHVHDPLYLLRKCYNLLNKRGYIWIDTPNIDSEGHRIYGRNWRGLEPPRHLVLFSYNSLRKALMDAGFSNIQDQPYRPLCKDLFKASEAVSKGEDPYNTANNINFTKECKLNVKNAEAISRNEPSKREFITLKAWRLD